MNWLSIDTRPEAEAILTDLLREAPAWRKLQMMNRLNTSLRTLAMSGLRQRHPNASEAELRRRLADLLLGSHLAAQVYGPYKISPRAPMNEESALAWYRSGGEVSDRQWGDIRGVIRVQGERLNLKYLRQQAEELKVLDLLEKALS